MLGAILTDWSRPPRSRDTQLQTAAPFLPSRTLYLQTRAEALRQRRGGYLPDTEGVGMNSDLPCDTLQVWPSLC